MAIHKFIIPFSLGVATGVVVAKNWPRIKQVGGPLVKDAIAKGRETVQSGQEKFSDLIAEIREEESKQGGEVPSASQKEPAV